MNQSVRAGVTGTVHVIDAEEVLRDALGWLLRSRRLLPRVYPSADAFDAAIEAGDVGDDEPACLLLDMRMPGMNGMALFERLIERGWIQAMPVIFLTGHADVGTAVSAVKRGAFDFVEKPFSDNALVDRVIEALQASAATLAARRAVRGVERDMSELTEREREVMRLIVEGKPNKLIADALDISVRTVEVHRSRVFDKMGVKSAVELANLLRDHGLG
ncbi:response regulator transcription factor [Leptothrix discophora]|uniref:LuxR C-terminal-related transcriptional regulator n=1 Tax=Leptothrix discophora TaxID=89 RepID=A0ABT9G993_LEPDI|nr:LuxR C-terminal-related transcriptional regulator [Leptothrix discophora]MDP4302927.1 LuxR C-terminal-related transcriptional regulator [Leptothrix discophora]